MYPNSISYLFAQKRRLLPLGGAPGGQFVAKKRRINDPNRGSDDLSREDFGPSPEDHPGAKAFIGYLRQAPDKAKWRLYLGLDFDDYLEIPQDALIEQRALATRSNPLAGTVVWIRAGAVLRRVTVSVREAQAEFLRGEIVAENLARASMSIPSPGQQPTTGTSDPTMCRPCFSYPGGSTCPGGTLSIFCSRPTLICPTVGCPSLAW